MKRLFIILIMILIWLNCRSATVQNVYTTNLTSAPLIVHVVVQTNGYMTAQGWVPDTANPLQDAINYCTNFAGGVYTFAQSSLGLIIPYITTNRVGASIEVNGVFYQPGGFTIPNQYCFASWHLYGEGNQQSVIIGDSNVLQAATNVVIGKTISSASTPTFELDHLFLCFSNEAQKAIGVDCTGIGSYSFIHDNYFAGYESYVYTNVWGAVGGLQIQGLGPQGNVELVVNGGNGQQVVYNNVFNDGAVNLVCQAQHFRIYDNEFNFAGGYGGCTLCATGWISTNSYASNDVTAYFNYGGSGSGTSVMAGYQLALGAAIICYGDDYESRGNKLDGDVAGEFFYPINVGGYGPAVIDNEHLEALNGGAAIQHAYVFQGANSQAPIVGMNGNAQGSAQAQPQVYSFNTNTYVLTLGSGSSTTGNEMYSTAWQLYPSGNAREYAWLIDNVPVLILDQQNAKLTLTNTWSFNGSAAGLTGFTQLTQNRGSYTLANATAQTLAGACSVKVRCVLTNGVQAWLTNITSGDADIAGPYTSGALGTNVWNLTLLGCKAGDSIEFTQKVLTTGAGIINAFTNGPQ